ncbi:MAG: response regulator transcription factor [Leptospiraceae bacterium]|nr:response regulator transcription factor [Leptospiraceae bacterium]MCZ8346500.1 response regulator transcription factor [Leptospiraceae bacterium]
MKNKLNPLKSKLKIGIVENDDLFLEEVVDRLSKIEWIGKVIGWKSSELFLRDNAYKDLDIVFLDIVLPGMSGIDLVSHLTSKNEIIKVIMLTNMNSDEMIFKSIKNGALGYLLKSELGQIEPVLEVIQDGGAFITPTIALRVFESFRRPKEALHFNLTDREKQILELLTRGKKISSVSNFLDLSEHTVNGYVKSIYKKLQVHNRAELVTKVQKYGIL